MITPLKEFETKNIYEYTSEMAAFLRYVETIGVDVKSPGFEIYANNGRYKSDAAHFVEIQKSKDRIDLVDVLRVWSE